MNDKFISFDNLQTCVEKVLYARNKGIGGVIIWELGGGYRSSLPAGKRDSMMQAIKQSLLLSVPPGRGTVPAEFRLSQNFPNPFNPVSEIRFELPVASHVKLAVYDVLGREVASLVDGFRSAGAHSARFSGDGRPSGLYFYRLSAVTEADPSKTFAETRAMLLLK